jgi:mRNA interferase MazF
MKRTLPGEIWRVDLGLAAKVRPALILSDYPADEELALLVVIPHTTAVRGNRWELAIPKAFSSKRCISSSTSPADFFGSF